jgi:hypothetical protein
MFIDTNDSFLFYVYLYVIDKLQIYNEMDIVIDYAVEYIKRSNS